MRACAYEKQRTGLDAILCV